MRPQFYCNKYTSIANTMAPMFPLGQLVMKSFTLGGLLFDADTAFVFNIESTKAIYHCEQHMQACVDFISIHTPIVFKAATLNGKSILCAHIVLLGMTACTIGYIDAANIPNKSVEFMCNLLYQVIFSGGQSCDYSVGSGQ